MESSRRMRAALAVGLVAALASCGPNGTIRNPVAGMQNPFPGLGGGIFDPDMRGRIGGPLSTAGAGGAGTGAAPGAVVDPFAGQGVRQPDIPAAGGGTQSTGAPAAGTTAPAAATTHKVAAGETAWSISRRYGVTVDALARANALPENMTVRLGQVLTIPPGAARAGEPVTLPGSGTPTPPPPSASQPLPREDTRPASASVERPQAPDLGATRTAASGGTFRMPVSGSIIRAYAKGRNDGIDIAATPGTQVRAAGSGLVAAITSDTQGAPIVVIRHAGTLMTVYTGLASLSVKKGDSVSAGQTIGTAGSAGSIHFEVRQGFESVDPMGYLG